MSKSLDLIGQVLQNGAPLTRPTPWASGLYSFGDADAEIAQWKLFPGAAQGDEPVEVELRVQRTEITYPSWMGVTVGVVINRIPLPAMPAQLYVGDWSAEWSAIVHYPTLSMNPPFNGVFSALIRGTWVETANIEQRVG